MAVEKIEYRAGARNEGRWILFQVCVRDLLNNTIFVLLRCNQPVYSEFLLDHWL